MPNLQSKNHFLSNDYFNERQSEETAEFEVIDDIGTLGGEVSSEMGFGDLEAAKDHIESFKPWNQEEWELIEERAREEKSTTS